MEARLALDTTQVTLVFDARSEESRSRVAQLYRLGRVLQHASTEDQISIEVDLPRRLLSRFTDVVVSTP
jgi:hypothetical protein